MKFHVCHIRLNNRKARLARTAKDVRPSAADVDNPIPDKQRGSVLGSHDTTNSPGDASDERDRLLYLARIASEQIPEPSLTGRDNIGSQEFGTYKAGQNVMLVGGGEDIGKGKVFQVRGKWYGKSLEELATCVVDVTELKADKGLRLPYPSEATGTSFAEAETKLGVMRVLWDLQRLRGLQPERVK